MLHKELTIVIPTKNEEKYIGNILNDISNQYDIKETKIIISDSSDDKTLDIVSEFKDKLNIVVTKGGKVSEARNNGFKQCNTEYVLFLDADVRLNSPYLIYENLIQLKSKKFNKDRALLTCPSYCYSNSLKCKIGYMLYNIIHKIITLRYPFAIGGFFMVDSGSFKKFGNFNEFVDNSEDFLFSQNYTVDEFIISKYKIGLDDRRFLKIGYWGTLKHLIYNFYSFLRKDKKHFYKKSGYWG